ncbi:MAG: alcohol dehydrogenase catalytic domain-containing protein [Phycisphaerae bacterium]|nr:alcohol dehydrogenase catalytic domain-containing protein [Phycisphaerae bacterium]
MNTNLAELPKTQYAVQLVGPSELTLNKVKEVFKPGPHQIVAKIEAVGLCFSDLKLLKQFTEHARKSEIVSGISPDVLKEIPSYVPGDKPVVPGHEAVCTIVAVGDEVRHHKLGERCLVQTDYRELKTAGSNAAFGYNFEGALQEYVLMDERVVMDPKTSERFLIPVGEGLSASAVCLVEPWACVENSYVNPERQCVKSGGRMLVVAEAGHRVEGLKDAVATNKPAAITAVVADASQFKELETIGVKVAKVGSVELLANESFDDIIYFGAVKATVEILNDKLAPRGLMNLVTGGKKFGEPVIIGVGRVHYGMTRWIGTTSENAAESYKHIPATGEIREGEKIVVIGAGGPMGQMHVIRDICAGVKNVSLTGTDFDDARLASLMNKAEPLAKSNGVQVRMINPQKTPMNEKFSYIALMAPVGALVANAITDSVDRCLINIFAGIPAPVKQALDLDTYIANRCYMFGTSGSVIRDMKIVLSKIEKGQLDTNVSVDAICGMAGAVEGLAAVENRTLAGKIIVYPMLHELGLVPLAKLAEKFPTVAAKLDQGGWTKAAEEELLKVAE